MSTAQMLRMQVLEMALRMPWVGSSKQAVAVAVEFQSHVDGAAPAVDSADTPRRAKRLSDAEFVSAINAGAGKSGNSSALGENHGSASDTNFGFALKCLKSGKRVARAGWNGKGMFVYLVPAASYPVQTCVAKSHFGEGSMVPYNAYLALKGADDTVSTWAPSGSDALADDWQLVE